VASSLGDKLQPVLEHLGSVANEAMLAEFERSPDLFVEFLIAALKKEASDVSSIVVVRMLLNALPGEDKKNEFEQIIESLKVKAPQHLQRCADAISFVVSCLSLYPTPEKVSK
jgi:hypothetical protein